MQRRNKVKNAGDAKNLFSQAIKIFGIAMMLSIAMPVFAESAPVYDVDSLPQQFDDNDQQDLPPPPAPQQSGQQRGAFVPNQAPANSATLSPRLSDTEGLSNENLSVEQRVKRVEQQISNMQTSETTSRIEALQNQVQSLRGQVEQLTHQIEQMQTQQKNLYSDLDKRISQQSGKSTAKAQNSNESSFGEDATVIVPKTTKETAKAGNKPSKPVNASETTNKSSLENQPNVAEEQQIYQTAYSLIKAKKYNDAVDTLQGMLRKYPSGQFASNAHYWLGELYGLMGKNDQALTEFSTVVKTYPNSPRISDAQLKVGLILAAQSKWPEAKAMLKKVMTRYPGTDSARLASEQLKQIKEAGH